MGYTALEAVRNRLEAAYGAGFGPDIPRLATREKRGSLAWCALNFLRENCERLRFDELSGFTDAEIEEIRNFTDSLGCGYSAKQIPYYMQKDIDRFCLERTLGDFLAEGTTQAAYLVYFCYLELFWDGPQAIAIRRMVEQLSEFEKNASPLISRHRDHFVHTVYVFAIGLAIYHKSPLFQEAYRQRYQRHFNGMDPAHHFLKYWGFTALFHDLGYPFELSFEQVKNYFSAQSTPAFHTCYNKGPEFQKDEKEEAYAPFYQELIRNYAPDIPRKAETADTVFAALLTNQLYDAFKDSMDFDAYRDGKPNTRAAFFNYLREELEKKPTDPLSFGRSEDHGFIDHAYFSAYLVLHHLGQPNSRDIPELETMEALTAILLHNSLFKYTILKGDLGVSGGLRMEMDTHPLAFLLMLADELQCWNRFGYGRKSRRENNPIESKFELADDRIDVTYYFDLDRDETEGVIKKFSGKSNPFPFLTEMQAFLKLNQAPADLTLIVRADFANRPAMTGEPLSECSFLNTFQLATVLNAEYQSRVGYNKSDKTARPYLNPNASEAERIAAFNALSLEYKLANFYQVQQFADHLSRIGCFFTDREVAFPELDNFSVKQLKDIGNWEHMAWVRRKRAMGWRHGDNYLSLGKDDPEKYALRERMREHRFIDVKFMDLPADYRQNDMAPIVKFKNYMKTNYRVRIYMLKKK